MQGSCAGQEGWRACLPVLPLSLRRCRAACSPHTTTHTHTICPPSLPASTHALALAASELAGMFLGALLVWLHYLPHFKTVPEPAPAEASDLLLRRQGGGGMCGWVGGWVGGRSGPAAAQARAGEGGLVRMWVGG